MTTLNKELFTEVSSTEAEVIQGGYKFTGYDYGGYGTVAQADRGIPDMKYPNTMEQVYITEGKWQLYDSDNYKNPIGDPIGPTNGKYYYLPKGVRDKANSVLKVG
jgi:hypothetical protein